MIYYAFPAKQLNNLLQRPDIHQCLCNHSTIHYLLDIP